MSTNMTGFGWFSEILASLYLGQKVALSIGRVKVDMQELGAGNIVYSF